MSENNTYTVTQFNRMVKAYLDQNDALKNFYLEGEISNIVYYKTGHLYFQLKDKNSQVKCAAFNYKMKRIPEDLKEGDSIKLFGDIGFYEVRGDFQILVRHVEKLDILGEMFAKLEKLKKELAKEGFFDPEHKKKLPKYPKNIGVVTAFTGAAVHDIINTAKKRDNSVNIYIYPAKVQGSGAAEEIVAGIKKLNQMEEIDLIIAGRGGGSIEDLWAFNEKIVALAFYNSKKPIISAVGHEIDYLLSDMVADVRAATPTQAIEIAVPERAKTIYEVESKWKYLKTIYNKYIEYLQNEIDIRKNNYYIRNFGKKIDLYNDKIVDLEKHLNKCYKIYFNNLRNSVELQINKIIGLNPLKTLERGYSVLMSNNKVTKDVEDIGINDEIEVRISNGRIKGIVKEIIKN
ncbi:exodeoxyribonuclease VII large subunit [Fusobacterium sp. PH5-44]|uniref:exodeoxyribonuclease VII large subunit n=1 Tax=unclassified Fusobacterium TaxID=2648384 RepID=UPI003D2637E0